MKVPAIATPYLAAAGVAAVAGLVLIVWIKKKGVAGVAADVVGAASDVAGGLVTGVGQLVGVPATDDTECERARREGRTWDASFVCPAGTWLSYLFTPSSAPATTPTTGDFARLDRGSSSSAYGQDAYFDPMTGLAVH